MAAWPSEHLFTWCFYGGKHLLRFSTGGQTADFLEGEDSEQRETRNEPQAGLGRRETGRRLYRLEENEHQEMFQVYPSAEKCFCNLFVSVPHVALFTQKSDYVSVLLKCS